MPIRYSNHPGTARSTSPDPFSCPPPLTAGSAQAYGSDGNKTAQQALGEAAQLSVTMLSQYSGPVLGLGFNAAMTLGSVINGDAAGVVQFGGQLAMNALEIAALVNPCGLAAKGLAAYGATVTGSQLFEPGGFTLQNFLLTSYNLLAMFGACFTGDMLLLCEGGKKRAGAIQEGDLLWSRDEHDPDGPLVLKRVLRRFERTAKIWHVRLPGQVLRTTLEHPFWVENRQSWLPVGELRVGDVLRTDACDLLAVEAIEDSDKWERVYNWEIEDYHTYFVSASEDGANIWAHNVGQGCGQGFTPDQDALIQMAKVLKRTGVLAGDVGTLQQWANEVGLLFRGPEIHPNRPHVNFPHIHIGPVDHIPVL